MFDIYDSQTRIIQSKVADQPTSVKTPLCRLKLLVDALSKSNPFYRRKLIEAGILDSSFLQSIEDIVKLPMTTREELMNNQLSSPPFGENHTYSMDRYIHWHKTSGTNGKPLHWFDTKESWDWWLDCWKTVFDAAEVTSKDRAFFPFSFGPFIGFWTAWDAAGRIGILCFSGAAQNSLQRIKNIIDFGITVICCTPTYALHLADVAKEEGIDLQGSSVEKIIVAGEPGGSIPEIKGLIEKRWGAMVFDHVGLLKSALIPSPASKAARCTLTKTSSSLKFFDAPMILVRETLPANWSSPTSVESDRRSSDIGLET